MLLAHSCIDYSRNKQSLFDPADKPRRYPMTHATLGDRLERRGSRSFLQILFYVPAFFDANFHTGLIACPDDSRYFRYAFVFISRIGG